jgi:hypothetical protein
MEAVRFTGDSTRALDLFRLFVVIVLQLSAKNYCTTNLKTKHLTS